MRTTLCAAVIFGSAVAVFGQTATGPATTRAVARTDANGNPIRVAKTGHVSNYDEGKVGTYTLPDPLVMADGTKVVDAAGWERRRAQILGIYEREIFGKVPATAPKVTWAVESNEGGVKRVVGMFGGVRVPLTLVLPEKAAGRVPVVLCLNFPVRLAAGAAPATAPSILQRGPGGEPVSEILAKGWGYATVTYTDIQPDAVGTETKGVIAEALKAARKEKVAPDEWGTISAWAWGASRVLDYLETDAGVDGTRVMLMGHSRLGKTVLWASAQDRRFAAIYSSCSGEMGAALSRRDYGETVDDMAGNFAWQFCGNVQKYVGKWNEMPVDGHMLIALSAPRPVLITGGTGDQWADPVGEFMGTVAAGPVYRVLGAKDVGATVMPKADEPLVTGELGYVYHTGGHAATVGDWRVFMGFAGRHLEK